MEIQEETYVEAVQRITDEKIRKKTRMSLPENASITHTDPINTFSKHTSSRLTP